MEAVPNLCGAGACCQAVDGELVRRRIEPELLGARPIGIPAPGDDVEELPSPVFAVDLSWDTGQRELVTQPLHLAQR